MDGIYEKTLRYDFYGELLTKRQQEVYEAVVFNDMSLSEAASEYGISRQGIHDMIRRSDEAMADYEEKLHAVRQYETVKRAAASLKEALNASHATKEEKKTMTALAETIEKAFD